MNQEQILEQLSLIGAVITDSHVVYTSGKHGSAYVNKDAVYPHTLLTKALATELAEYFVDSGAEVVAAPAIGAITLGHGVATRLSEALGRNMFSVYAEPEMVTEKPRFVFKRGYAELVRGKRVLAIEDVLTTGGSVSRLVDAVRALDGEVVGIGALCNRGGLTAEALGVPQLISLIEVALDAYPEDQCPLCAQGVPINTQVGKGTQFLARRRISNGSEG